MKTEKLCSLPAVIVAADKVGDSFQRVLEAMSIAGMEAEPQRVETGCGVWRFARQRHQGQSILGRHDSPSPRRPRARDATESNVDSTMKTIAGTQTSSAARNKST